MGEGGEADVAAGLAWLEKAASLENALEPDHPELLEAKADYAEFLRRLGRDAEAGRIDAR